MVHGAAHGEASVASAAAIPGIRVDTIRHKSRLAGSRPRNSPIPLKSLFKPFTYWLFLELRPKFVQALQPRREAPRTGFKIETL